jgi:hypothetical protein
VKKRRDVTLALSASTASISGWQRSTWLHTVGDDGNSNEVGVHSLSAVPSSCSTGNQMAAAELRL